MIELDPLWDVLRDAWPLRWPRALLHEEIGPSAMDWLKQTECRLEVTLGKGDAYPSRTLLHPTCMRRVVERPALAARCDSPLLCAEEPLSWADLAAIEINEKTLMPVVQRSLRLTEGWAPEGEVLRLGERRFGDRPVDFVFAARPRRESTLRCLEDIARENDRRGLTVVTFHRKDTLRRASLGSTPVEWLALSDALPQPKGLLFNFMDLWRRFAPGWDPGPDRWPRHLFTVDPRKQKAWYAGQPLALDRNDLAFRLLVALLWKHSQWLNRDCQLRVLYPEETPARREALGDGPRRARHKLGVVFGGLVLPAGLRPDPIETLATRGDTVGGYRIDVPGHQIDWLSQPDEDLLRACEDAR